MNQPRESLARRVSVRAPSAPQKGKQQASKSSSATGGLGAPTDGSSPLGRMRVARPEASCGAENARRCPPTIRRQYRGAP